MPTDPSQAPWWSKLIPNDPALIETLLLKALAQTVSQLLDRLAIGPQTPAQLLQVYLTNKAQPPKS